MKILIALLIAISFIPVFSQSVISFDVDTAEFTPGQTVELSGSVNAGVAGQPVSIEVKDGAGNVILIRTVSTDDGGEFTLTFKIPESAEPGEFEIIANVEIEGDAFSAVKTIEKATIQDTQETLDDFSTFLPYLGIIIVAIIAGILTIKLKNSKKGDELSEDYEYEDDSVIENAPPTKKFQDMQTGSQSDSGNNMEPHKIIENKLQMISKLQENKIGDFEKLEEIKKSLINEGVFSEDDYEYLEEKYDEYKKSDSANEKK